MSTATLSLNEIIFGDLERELTVTRAVLERLPEDQYGWKVHPKSMSLGQLALHVATLPDWARATIEKDELDAATAPRPPKELEDRKMLLELFDKQANALREAVKHFDASKYGEMWTMRNGPQVMTSKKRSHVYRVWCINHLIHHRAQLCVYLRLLNVPVPTVYFNTADDPTWVFE